MISLGEASELVRSGKVDPKKDLPHVPQDVFRLLDSQASILLAYMLDASTQDREPIEKLMPVLKNLASVCGWYPTAAVLTSRFALWYRSGNVPSLFTSESSDDLLDLVRALPEIRKGGGPVPWVAVDFVLAKAGKDEALEITAGVIMCASMGYIESSLEKREEIDTW